MFYGFDMARMSKGLLGDLLVGNIGVEIPTYVRNDNRTVAYQVDSVKAVGGGNRLGGFLASNRGGLRKQSLVNSTIHPQKGWAHHGI